MKLKYKILIVDDDPAILKVLANILEEHYRLKFCSSGEEALRVITKFHPDIVLLDIMMSGLSGYEVCKTIRENKSLCYTKIIFLTGMVDIEERLKGYEVGGDEYITKPFDYAELIAKIQVFLQLKRTEEVDKIKSDLLTLFTHETRTPLNGIMYSANMLIEEESLDPEYKEFASMILDSSERLLNFMKKSAFLCNLKSGIELKESKEAISLHLKTIINDLELFAKKNHNTVEIDVKNDVEINADWMLLQKVFYYIIHNAIKFSIPNGIINTSIDLLDGNAIISISDKGKGIQPEWVDKIFDEFAILDVMHHQVGQGLSLAICKNIIDLHDGEIQVENNQDIGTTFKIILPKQG